MKLRSRTRARQKYESREDVRQQVLKWRGLRLLRGRRFFGSRLFLRGGLLCDGLILSKGLLFGSFCGGFLLGSLLGGLLLDYLLGQLLRRRLLRLGAELVRVLHLNNKGLRT